MSKTLETKKKILNLLKKKEMTITGLSEELGLSTATISQHMEELQRMGAVEKIDNEHFKKLKYYKASESATPMVIKYVLGAIVLLAIAGVVFLYHGNPAVISTSTIITPASHLSSNGPFNNTNSTSITAPSGPRGQGAFACPLLYYQINGTVTNYTGMSLYYLNFSGGANGKIADYVLGGGSTGELYVTENISNVLSEPANSTITDRQHYYVLTFEGAEFNTHATGLNVSISPENYTINHNEIVNFTATITANSTAMNTTYLLRIDGPCGGGVTPVLITVGSEPYSGNVTEGSGIYA